MTALENSSTLAEWVNRLRDALFIEMSNNLLIRAKIKGDFFEVNFSTGESAVINREALKDEWESLIREVRELEQKHNPDSGDAVDHCNRPELVMDERKSNEVTDRSENPLSMSNEDSMGEILEPVDYSSMSLMVKPHEDVRKGVSPTTKNRSVYDEGQKEISNDDTKEGFPNITNRVWTNQVDKLNQNSKTEISYAEIQNKFDSQIERMEKMMSVTIALHSKMQDNLKLWLKNRELDEGKSKVTKISDVTLSSSEKIPLTTIINKHQVSGNNELNTLEKTSVKFNVNSSKDSNEPRAIANHLKEAIRIEFIGKDSHMKHDYKLKPRIKFDHFYEFLTSELRTIDLLYVIDDSLSVPEDINENQLAKHKFKVRDILINRIDKIYHNRILQIKDPLEMLNKIKEIKRCENNVTSVSVRKQLYAIQYNANRESANAFLDRFEEIIHNYETIPGSTPLSDDEKRDALYNAILNQLPEVQSVEFLTKNQTGKSLTYELLKMFVMQAEANRLQNLSTNHPMSKTVTVASASFTNSNLNKWSKERCFECGDMGHLKNECPHKGLGLKKCYECNEFTTHKAADCLQRLRKEKANPNKYIREKRYVNNYDNKYENRYKSNNKRSFKLKDNRNKRDINPRPARDGNPKPFRKNDSTKIYSSRPQNQTRTGTTENPKFQQHNKGNQ